MRGPIHKRSAVSEVVNDKGHCRRIACALIVLLPFAGCVNPSERIATSLTASGLEAGQAQCIGDRLERNLSIGQLQELGRAARAYNEDDPSPGRLTASDLVRVASRFENAKVPIEVGKAAAGCGVLTGTPSSAVS